MAIAIDATSQSGAWNNAESSVTWSHTCSGSDRTLVVHVNNFESAVTVSGVTYNGVALTQIGSRISSDSTSRWVTSWRLIAPASGANNVVVTLSGTDYVRTNAISLTGTNQTTQPNTSSDHTTSGGGTINQSVTTTGTTWLVWGVDSNATGVAGTGTTAIYTANELQLFRSTAAVSGGSNSLQVTGVGATFAGKLVAVAEAGAAVATYRRGALLGVGQ